MTTSLTSQNIRFYGWTTLAGAMLAYGSICGNVTYAYGVFLPAMSTDFGVTRSILSGPYTLFLMIGGLLGPLAGWSVSRFGARQNIVMGNVLAAGGLFGLAWSTQIWQVYLFFGLLGGLALTFAEYLSATTVINSWFISKRSLALGFLFAAGGIGGFFLPPAISLLIGEMGWRWTWGMVAGLHLLLGVGLAGWLIRNSPEEEGQLPDGYPTATLKSANALQDESTSHNRKDWPLSEALRSKALWMLMALFSVLLFAHNMMAAHQVAYLQDLNYSPTVSATALGLMLGMSILGRMLSGVLGMKISSRYLAAFFLTCTGSGIVSLLYAGQVFFVYLYSVLTGVGVGGMIVLIPHATGAYFGRKHFSRIVGWTAPVVTLASAISPLFAGFLYDRTGGYTLPFAIAAGLVFACAILALRLHAPQKPESAL